MSGNEENSIIVKVSYPTSRKITIYIRHKDKQDFTEATVAHLMYSLAYSVR